MSASAGLAPLPLQPVERRGEPRDDGDVAAGIARARLRACARCSRRSSAIAAWFANRPSRSISRRREAVRCGRSSTWSTPSARSSCEQRHGHDPLRDVARPLGDVLARAAGRSVDVLDHERLAGDEHPAGDARAGRDPRADQPAVAPRRRPPRRRARPPPRRAGRSTSAGRRRSRARPRRSTGAASP